MNPLVSIIVPVYNRAPLIGETLESIRAQTYPHIELLVVDDGSTDATLEVVRAWLEKTRSPGSRVLAMPRNGGKSTAVNSALEQVSGTYVMIFDSDDVLLPDAIANEVRFLEEHSDVGFVAARAYIMNGGVKTTRTFDTLKEHGNLTDMRSVYGDLLLKGNPIISSTVLMRRTAVQEAGGMDRGLQYTHDWEYWIRISKTHKIGFLASPVMYYRVDTVGASSQHRYGTFKETCWLLFRSASDYTRGVLTKALVYQTKYNAWLAYHDSNLKDLLQIVLLGSYATIRLLFGAKRL